MTWGPLQLHHPFHWWFCCYCAVHRIRNMDLGTVWSVALLGLHFSPPLGPIHPLLNSTRWQRMGRRCCCFWCIYRLVVVNANNNGTSTGSMFVRMLCKHPHSLIFGNNNNHTHMDKLEHCPMNDLAAGNRESKRTQKHLSNESHIVLNSVQSQSMGKYSCEVSADAPSFHTLYDSVDLKVVGKLFCFLQALQTLECLMPFPWRDLIVTIRRGGTATAGKEMTIKGIHWLQRLKWGMWRNRGMGKCSVNWRRAEERNMAKSMKEAAASRGSGEKKVVRKV